MYVLCDVLCDVNVCTMCSRPKVYVRVICFLYVCMNVCMHCSGKDGAW